MGLRVALASGGKDSLYAAYITKNIDALLFIVYEFPVLSPHIVNIKASIATLSMTGYPIIVLRVKKGSKGDEIVDLLKRLNVAELVAGDVYVEDHYKYYEDLTSRAGVVLREPLWGMDPEELLYKIVDNGFSFKIIGVKHDYKRLLGETITSENVAELSDFLKQSGGDPLGERGEYHTLVIDSPLHMRELRTISIGDLIDDGYHYIIRVEPVGMPWSP